MSLSGVLIQSNLFIAEDELYSVTNLNMQIEQQFSAKSSRNSVELEDVQFSWIRNYMAPLRREVLIHAFNSNCRLLNSDVVSLVMVENWFEELRSWRPSFQLSESDI